MPSDLGPVQAPGLKSRANADGSRRYYWFAPAEALKLGYKPRADDETATNVRVFGDDKAQIGREFILCEAERLQAEADRYIEEHEKAKKFDGTVRALIGRYETDAESPFQALKWNTRRSYLHELKRLRASVGDRHLSTISRADVDRWYKAALRPKTPGGDERVRGARGLMTMLRILVDYGVSIEIAHCSRVDMILGKMRFKRPKPRIQRPTYEQTLAIIAKAKEMGAGSIALGQAMQFDGVLRQTDVTGQWRPLAEGETVEGGIVLNGRVWEDGLSWSHLGENMVLTFTTAKRDRQVEIDFSLYPLAMTEILAVPRDRRIGPMIIDERSGLPYAEMAYSKRWRAVATAAGIPASVWNRDTRAGGITEGRDSGAEYEDLAKQAGHTDPNFTATVYSRDNLEAARRIANKRAVRRASGE